MRVCKHGCDITQILIGYVLSEVHFYWLVGNMSVYQESPFQSRSKKQHFPSIEDFFCVYTASSIVNTQGSWENSRQLCKPETQSTVCITVSNSPNSPAYLDEVMCPVNTEKSPLSLKEYTCTRKIQDSLR